MADELEEKLQQVGIGGTLRSSLNPIGEAAVLGAIAALEWAARETEPAIAAQIAKLKGEK